ncbi:PAS domain S-box protein [uncultured Propionivibrio sp.]|uniref:PAS domain S-box protein n=1 Tax=uncultured Propionivibrio sp. TaxID=426737 RepID=UPI0029C0B7CB|nr:PAS domain S-box protein [uncultured Propionivibrio sp.]
MIFIHRQTPAWRRISSVRAVVLLSTGMIAVLAISAAMILFDLRQKELVHAQQQSLSLTRLLSEQTTRAFDGIVLMMRGVRDRMDDVYGQRQPLNSLPVSLLLKVRSAGLPQVKSIFLVDRDGFGVNSSRDDFIRQLRMQDRAFFRYFADGGSDEIFISRPEKARVDGEWTYYVGIALHDGAGHFRGVLVSAVNIDYFDSLYGSVGLDAVSQIVLLNQHGELAAGQFRGDEAMGTVFGNRGLLAGLAGHSGKSTMETRVDADGARRFVAYRAVANYPFFVGVVADEAVALASWWSVARPIAIGIVMVIVFVVFTTWVFARNLARKELLELALLESGEQLRHMIESARDAIVTLDAQGRVLMANTAAVELLGISAEQAVGRRLIALLDGKIPARQLDRLARSMDRSHPLPGVEGIEVLDLNRDGRTLFVELSLSAAQFRGETLLTAVFRDATERRRAEQQLRDSHRQLQELSASLQRVREDERSRIARELHDELGQLLTGIRLEISWLGGRLIPEQRQLSERIVAIKEQIDQTIASVRRISSELRPLVLDDLGLVDAAHWYIDQFSERTGIQVERHLPDSDITCDSAVATALFRILQESMTNVARHAQASRLKVRLSHGSGEWRLDVEDDGQGFVYDDGQCCGNMGLVGMRERAQMLGGYLEVESASARGTRIRVVIPGDGQSRDNDGKA